MKLQRFDYYDLQLKTDAPSPVKVTETREGFLRVRGRIMRAGTLEYSDGESNWKEFRPREEIERSLDSFKLVALTDDHPADMVTPDTVRDVQVGQIGSAFDWEGDFVVTDFLITDAQAIQSVKDGKVQLSVGFVSKIEPEQGTYRGDQYVAVQREIEGNHVALVDRGRAGPMARLITDGHPAAYHFEDSMSNSKKTDDRKDEVSLLIGGEEMMVPDAAAQLIEQLQQEVQRLAQELEAAKAEQQPEEAPAEGGEAPAAAAPAPVAMDTAEKYKARIDALEAQLKSVNDTFSDRVSKRVDLVSAAAEILGERSDGSDNEIMAKVVAKVIPSLAEKIAANKENGAYLRAAYDSAVDVWRSRREQDSGGDLLATIHDSIKSGGVPDELSEYLDAADKRVLKLAGGG